MFGWQFVCNLCMIDGNYLPITLTFINDFIYNSHFKNIYTCSLSTSPFYSHLSTLCCIIMNNTHLENRSRSLQWRYNDRHGVSNHRRPDCLINRLFRRGSKKTSKLRVTSLCEGNPPVTSGFPSQTANNAENVSICWRHYVEADIG